MDVTKENEPPAVPEKLNLLRKYDIPVQHLDFAYVKQCTNGNELEKILHVLQSGEEGHYPDLVQKTEERLSEIKPNSRYIRKVSPVIDKSNLEKSEQQELEFDLSAFLKRININNNELQCTKKKILEGIPDVRETKQEVPLTENKVKRISTTDYRSWDKYDPDEELLKMDINLEQKKAQEMVKKKNENAKKRTVTFNEFTTNAEATTAANSEREKGNDFFRAAEYQTAVTHYTNSIKFLASAANYNNRAAAYLKLKKYEEAIKDCKSAIKFEPNNVKAIYRLAQSYEATKESRKALDVAETALRYDPNNTAIQGFIQKLTNGVVDVPKTRMKISDNGFRSNPYKPYARSRKIYELAVPGSSQSNEPSVILLENPTADTIKLHQNMLDNRRSRWQQMIMRASCCSEEDDECRVVHRCPRRKPLTFESFENAKQVRRCDNASKLNETNRMNGGDRNSIKPKDIDNFKPNLDGDNLRVDQAEKIANLNTGDAIQISNAKIETESADISNRKIADDSETPAKTDLPGEKSEIKICNLESGYWKNGNKIRSNSVDNLVDNSVDNSGDNSVGNSKNTADDSSSKAGKSSKPPSEENGTFNKVVDNFCKKLGSSSSNADEGTECFSLPSLRKEAERAAYEARSGVSINRSTSGSASPPGTKTREEINAEIDSQILANEMEYQRLEIQERLNKRMTIELPTDEQEADNILDGTRLETAELLCDAKLEHVLLRQRRSTDTDLSNRGQVCAPMGPPESVQLGPEVPSNLTGPQDASAAQLDASAAQQAASAVQHDARAVKQSAAPRDASASMQDASVGQRDASVVRQDASAGQRDASAKEASQVNQLRKRNAKHNILGENGTTGQRNPDEGCSSNGHVLPERECDNRAGGEACSIETSEFRHVHQPYTFLKLWKNVSRDPSFVKRAQLLRNVDFNRLTQVIGCKLDGNMLSEIIQTIYQHFTVAGELVRVQQMLANLTLVPRFGVIKMFLTSADTNRIRCLFEFMEQHGKPISTNVRDMYLK